MENIVLKLIKLGQLFCTHEFLSVHGTLCSYIGILGLLCSKLLSANGTICFQIGYLRLFFFPKFPFVNGTICSIIGN